MQGTNLVESFQYVADVSGLERSFAGLDLYVVVDTVSLDFDIFVLLDYGHRTGVVAYG